MTLPYNNPEVRELLFRLLRSPEHEQQKLLEACASRPEVAAAVRQALAEVTELLGRLLENPATVRDVLAAGPTLHDLIREAVEWCLPELRQEPLRDPIPSLQPGELLPRYSAARAEGTLFGEYYLIVSELSRGGMGVVYKAHDLRFDDKPDVALKVLSHIDPARIDLFRVEASNLFRLAREANVVGIRDFGTLPEPFIAMECVEGGSLQDALEAKTWPGSERDRATAAAQLVLTLARTLARAHSDGIFHLDLKPANILLHARGPLLADFSLSRRVVDGSGRVAILGKTPLYSAPEQAAQNVNAQAMPIDVYGAGIVLYELLTGRPPFLLEENESVDEFLNRIQREEPPRPSELAGGIPSDLEVICLHCLRKEPGQRYSTAAELADDLEAFLRGDQSSVAHWPWHRRARHRARTHWVALALSSLSIACLIGFILFLVSRAEAAEQRAERLQEEAKRRQENFLHAKQEAEKEQQHHRQQRRASARGAAAQGNWHLAMELYETAIRDHEPNDPERLVLEVERLPGWFLFRSREDVAAELDRLERVADLAAKERAKVRLYRGDLRMCADGRAPAVLVLIREARDSGALDRADALYAESLLAPTARAALDKLRELVKDYPGHYRGRVALLGLLLVRGELDELRIQLRLHEGHFKGDPSAALLMAELDVLQNDDLPSALARIDLVRDRLGQTRWQKYRAFLTEWVGMLRAVAHDQAPNLSSFLRLKVIVGGDRDVFSLNVPTITWLAEHWSAAADAFGLGSLTLFWNSEAKLAKWRALCADSPEATFLVNRALLELVVGKRLEDRGRKKESLEYYERAVELSYQAADARTPTLLPRSEWRYKALCMATLADVAYLASRDQPVEPPREQRLRDGFRRVVTEGRAHKDFRDKQLPAYVAQLSILARQCPRSLAHEMAQVLLVEWMQVEDGNPVPYRLLAQLALDFEQPATALHAVSLWYADKRHAKDAQLDGLGKKAREAVGRLIFPTAERKRE